MSKPWIVVGDRLDHGGTVITGASQSSLGGKPVARVGDRAICSEHGSTVIVSGDNATIIYGQAVARNGDKTACGATLISSQSDTLIE